MSRKPDKPLPVPPPLLRDPPPPPPPERPAPILPDGRAAWGPLPGAGLPRDPQPGPEPWCPKESPLVAVDRSPKQGHAAPSHLNGRPVPCAPSDGGFGRQHHRLETLADVAKVSGGGGTWPTTVSATTTQENRPLSPATLPSNSGVLVILGCEFWQNMVFPAGWLYARRLRCRSLPSDVAAVGGGGALPETLLLPGAQGTARQVKVSFGLPMFPCLKLTPIPM